MLPTLRWMRTASTKLTITNKLKSRGDAAMKRLCFVFAIVLLFFATPEPVLADSYACKTECSTCKHICEKTLKHCSEMGGEHSQPEHIKVLKDCIKACDEAEMSIGKKDSYEKDKCNTCLEACTKCAEFCEKMKDDKIMAKCAKECRSCVKALKARWGYNDSIPGSSGR